MSQKQPRPTLTGQRLRARKRDSEKHAKLDPEAFRDAVVVGLNQAEGDFDAASRFLDSQGGGKLDYNRYGETLFDILFAGGILASGGKVEDEGEGKTTFCVFEMETEDKVKQFSELLNKLTRRYKYLIKTLNESVVKIFKFLGMISDEQRKRFATLLAINFATHSVISPNVLTGLLYDHLVKDEISLNFLTELLKRYDELGPEDAVASLMRRGGIENRMLEFFPENKRKDENMEQHFNSNGLDCVVQHYKKREMYKMRGDLKAKLKDLFENGDSQAEIIATVDEAVIRLGLTPEETISLVWAGMMVALEANKKSDLLEKDTLRHIKANANLLARYASSGKTQLSLMVTMQIFCYDNMEYMKLFPKIVLLLYNNDVLHEDVVMKWYKDGHSSKAKSVFLKSMEPMIEWLSQAEEESEEE